MAREKLCLWCRWFDLSFGTDDYSEVTPGDPPACDCIAGHWYLGKYDFTMKAYRENMLRAGSCKDFEEGS